MMNNSSNWSSEECSNGGCDSGWTMYLDHDHQHSSNACTRFSQPINEDDDQSMLSDASSGPQHFQEAEDEQQTKKLIISDNHYAKTEKKARKKVVKQGIRKKLPFCHLDDTASSSIHNVSQPAAIVSTHKVSSSAHLKKKTGFGNHFGFSAKGRTGGLDGEEWD